MQILLFITRRTTYEVITAKDRWPFKDIIVSTCQYLQVLFNFPSLFSPGNCYWRGKTSNRSDAENSRICIHSVLNFRPNCPRLRTSIWFCRRIHRWHWWPCFHVDWNFGPLLFWISHGNGRQVSSVSLIAHHLHQLINSWPYTWPLAFPLWQLVYCTLHLLVGPEDWNIRC